jgi:putative flippase GtrA
MLTFLRAIRRRPVSQFILVGCVAACIDFAVFNLALPAVGASRPGALLANTASFGAATSVSFVLNSRYTFGVVRTRAGFARYLGVALVGVAIYDLALLLVLQWTPPGDVLLTNIAKAVAVFPSATWNYLGFRHFAFAVTRSPREGAQAGAPVEAGDGRR